MTAFPFDWFWTVADDTTRAWSSASSAYVTQWDAARVTRIASEEELSDVLRPYGLHGPYISERDYADAIQAHVDATAQSRGYGSGVLLASYTVSTVSAWAAEAAAFVAWRDAVWAYAYQQLAAVQAGQRQPPTIAGMISELPAITWP